MKLYLLCSEGYLSKECTIQEVEVTKESDKRYTLGSNKKYRNHLNKSEIGHNLNGVHGNLGRPEVFFLTKDECINYYNNWHKAKKESLLDELKNHEEFKLIVD
jgi:hypothetical protein